MRLKVADCSLSIHNNGNSNDILNSPKRLNTIQNSNLTKKIITTNLTTTTNNLTTNNSLIESNSLTENTNVLNNINSTQDKVQWCNPLQQLNKRELTNNNNTITNNRIKHLFNINNTLATSLRNSVRHGTASSIYSESSPDDSLLEFEDVHQITSSVDTTPQDEDRDFDLSDSESSDEGNLSNNEEIKTIIQHQRGIVNPNYPGFQHFAHTLDYSIKLSSDTDYTDDDYDYESINKKIDVNNINNNNPDDTELKIDSVNRLDSIENIQKVFYDKNIECENQSNQSDSDISVNSNQISDEDIDVQINSEEKVELNIKVDEKLSEQDNNIIGDFEREIQQEFGRISLENQSKIIDDVNQYELPRLEQAVVQELDETIDKLSETLNLGPISIKCNIEPNIEEKKPFNKLSVNNSSIIKSAIILDDSEIVKTKIMPSIQTNNNSNIITSKNENKTPDVCEDVNNIMKTKIYDAFLSNAQENIPVVIQKDSNRELEEIECQIKKIKSNTKNFNDNYEKFNKEDLTKNDKEKDEDSAVPRKKEKIDCYIKRRKDYNQQFGSLITFPRREFGNRNRNNLINRRSVPVTSEKKRTSTESLGGFDVYNIETAMPKIDLEAIESHLRAAREEERRRRTDREEIRRRLAMGSEDTDYYTDRPGRKPSLQARLQSGMNLQICFMNETVSDTESPNSDNECPIIQTETKQTSPNQDKNITNSAPTRPATLSIGQPLLQPVTQPMTETDFFTRQARLQTEARMALAQAKEMARMQMEIERQRQKKSPITEMVRHSLEKVGIPFPEEKRRLSRQILTEMNVAQLQVIVNDLHTQIENLNESLVKFLMNRDDLHMEQDSMLVDIEDLTRYLGAKEQVLKEQYLAPTQNNNIPPPSPAPSSPLSVLNSSMKPHLHRIASLVKK